MNAQVLVSYRFAIYEKRGRVAYVTLNRPEVMNALHLEAHLELAEIWEHFRNDAELWVAILTGAGERAFCAGNDLKATAERTAAGPTCRGASARRSGGSPGASTVRSR
jgi:enoyl-CoA hydratase/carnithine racemase